MSDVLQALLPQGKGLLGLGKSVGSLGGEAAVLNSENSIAIGEEGAPGLTFKVAMDGLALNSPIKLSPKTVEDPLKKLEAIDLESDLVLEAMDYVGDLTPIIIPTQDMSAPIVSEEKATLLNLDEGGQTLLTPKDTVSLLPVTFPVDESNVTSGKSSSFGRVFQSSDSGTVPTQSIYEPISESSEQGRSELPYMVFSKSHLMKGQGGVADALPVTEVTKNPVAVATAIPQLVSQFSLNGQRLDQITKLSGLEKGVDSIEATASTKEISSSLGVDTPRIPFEAGHSAVLDKKFDGLQNADALRLTVRFGQVGWAEQLVERAANLAGQNIKQAEIQLNPQELGPIHIKISIAQDQAAVTFAAQNAQVRDAIDQTLHRLRDAFESNGLDLVQADIRDQKNFQGGDGDGSNQTTSEQSSLDDEEATDAAQTLTLESLGIDHFV